MTNHRLANHEAIAAAKAGASHGIRVNCVAPGLVRTPLTARLTASAAGLKTLSALHPLGRVGEPEEMASALAWQIIGIDGALETVRPRVST
jgi:NAD(P)-dependent dehydrogenase (short-subunit alcohol dehydrogenase family)